MAKFSIVGDWHQIFVQPAARDAGGALGAAVAGSKEKKQFIKNKKLNHLFLGPHVGKDHEIKLALEAWSKFLNFEFLEEPSSTAAKLIANNEIIAWVQGRSEFGPRALGHRSILADPRFSGNKIKINKIIKKREDFRPFAPSVCEENISRLF